MPLPELRTNPCISASGGGWLLAAAEGVRRMMSSLRRNARSGHLCSTSVSTVCSSRQECMTIPSSCLLCTSEPYRVDDCRNEQSLATARKHWKLKTWVPNRVVGLGCCFPEKEFTSHSNTQGIPVVYFGFDPTPKVFRLKAFPPSHDTKGILVAFPSEIIYKASF